MLSLIDLIWIIPLSAMMGWAILALMIGADRLAKYNENYSYGYEDGYEAGYEAGYEDGTYDPKSEKGE